MKPGRSRSADGSAYRLPEPLYDSELVEVGAGTPAGELLRRYWHPVGVSSELADLPVPVRVLGEDLILFRTGQGRPGLVYPRCIHRGTTLRYGKVESNGIRCCYHGWLFDPEGRCLEQPCEPGGGRKLELYRQPWYPLEERYGLVFAYLGPPERRPLLPRYDVLEDLDEHLQVHPTSRTLQTGGPEVMPCNWVQTYENVADPAHAHVLHGMISGPQLGQDLASPPERLDFRPTEHGMTSHVFHRRGDGRDYEAVLELLLPTVSIVPIGPLTPDGRSAMIAWTLPIDDTHTRIFTAMVLPRGLEPPDSTHLPAFGGKSWFDLDDEGHQRFPGDYEAQVGQGAITFLSEEHLVSSDRGVSLFRRIFRQAMKGVAAGDDPPNVARSPEQARVRVRAAVANPPMQPTGSARG